MFDRNGKRLSFVRMLARSARSEVMEVERGGERLALKVVFSADDPVVSAAFEREVAALAAVDHPNVARLVDTGRASGGLAWLLMPLYEGMTLRDRLRGGRTLAPRRASRLFRDYLDGLEALHRAGVVHRDLSPRNLFIGREPGAARPTRGLLLDLGRAEVRVLAASGTDGHVTGTPGYLAPEQVLGGAIDPRTDVFALGLCLFEALAGLQAISGADPCELFDTGVPHLADVRPGVVAGVFGAVVSRATRIAPDDRFASAADFRDALGAAIAGAGEEAA